MLAEQQIGGQVPDPTRPLDPQPPAPTPLPPDPTNPPDPEPPVPTPTPPAPIPADRHQALPSN